MTFLYTKWGKNYLTFLNAYIIYIAFYFWEKLQFYENIYLFINESIIL